MGVSEPMAPRGSAPTFAMGMRSIRTSSSV